MVKTSVKLGKLAVYVNNTAQTVKVGSKGKSQPVSELFLGFSKGEARKLRKQLRKEGHPHIARVPAIPH